MVNDLGNVNVNDKSSVKRPERSFYFSSGKCAGTDALRKDMNDIRRDVDDLQKYVLSLENAIVEQKHLAKRSSNEFRAKKAIVKKVGASKFPRLYSHIFEDISDDDLSGETLKNVLTAAYEALDVTAYDDMVESILQYM